MTSSVRRNLVRQGVQALSVCSVLPLFTSRSHAATSCTDPSSEALRVSLHYSDAAPNPAQACAACGFFTAAQACGNCTIMSGPVDPKGHCDSWSPRGT
jgi:hypothetical protein